MKVKIPEAPAASEATVSVYFVALTVTTVPLPESLGEPLLAV